MGRKISLGKHKLRIIQGAVVVKATDSPKIPYETTLEDGTIGKGFTGGQKIYPVVIIIVKTGSEPLQRAWSAFLDAHKEDYAILYGGSNALDYAGRHAVSLEGDTTNHRQGYKRFAYRTVYRMALLTLDAHDALWYSGFLTGEQITSDAPAPLPRGGHTDYPHGKLHPSQRNNQKDAKRAAHTIMGTTVATVATVNIHQRHKIKPDRSAHHVPAADPFSQWPMGTFRDMPLTDGLFPDLDCVDYLVCGDTTGI